MKEVLIICLGSLCLLSVIGIPSFDRITPEQPGDSFVYTELQNLDYVCVNDTKGSFIGRPNSNDIYIKPTPVNLDNLIENLWQEGQGYHKESKNNKLNKVKKTFAAIDSCLKDRQLASL